MKLFVFSHSLVYSYSHIKPGSSIWMYRGTSTKHQSKIRANWFNMKFTLARSSAKLSEYDGPPFIVFIIFSTVWDGSNQSNCCKIQLSPHSDYQTDTQRLGKPRKNKTYIATGILRPQPLRVNQGRYQGGGTFAPLPWDFMYEPLFQVFWRNNDIIIMKSSLE